MVIYKKRFFSNKIVHAFLFWALRDFNKVCVMQNAQCTNNKHVKCMLVVRFVKNTDETRRDRNSSGVLRIESMVVCKMHRNDPFSKSQYINCGKVIKHYTNCNNLFYLPIKYYIYMYIYRYVNYLYYIRLWFNRYCYVFVR